MKSTHENENDDDDESVKDKEVRKHINVLSSRLFDLRERFMKITDNINKDLDGYADEISDEESNDETSVDEEETGSTQDDDDNENKPAKKLLLKSILESKARRHEYLKHVNKYPKIMKYILNDDPNCLQIPLRHLEPFIKDYIDDKPTGKIFDKITQQIQDIRQIYLNK